MCSRVSFLRLRGLLRAVARDCLTRATNPAV
jgi:hypothetical protein